MKRLDAAGNRMLGWNRLNLSEGVLYRVGTGDVGQLLKIKELLDPAAPVDIYITILQARTY